MHAGRSVRRRSVADADARGHVRQVVVATVERVVRREVVQEVLEPARVSVGVDAAQPRLADRPSVLRIVERVPEARDVPVVGDLGDAVAEVGAEEFHRLPFVARVSLSNIEAFVNALPVPQTDGMKILGIDPGFDRLGFGMIEEVGSSLACIEYGCVYTQKESDLTERLNKIFEAVTELIKKHNPEAIAVEQLFFQTNAKTAIKVGMARGVILLAIARAGAPLVELTPSQVKTGVTGYGNADKRQVQDMVQRLLKLVEVPTPDDAADALAIAIVGSQIARKIA